MRYTQNVKTIQSRCHLFLVNILTSERTQRGIPQTELAKRLKEHQNWISRLERGQRRVDVCEFLILAEKIGFDPIKALKKLVHAIAQPGPAPEIVSHGLSRRRRRAGRPQRRR
jgi:transcriptional regulator with XRE-family HTH domain